MTDTILPHALPSALDGRDAIKLLSLDCFDTLLWRDSHAPSDLFGALPGTNVHQRQWAEMHARSAEMLRHGRNEVGIDAIYRELLPNAAADARAEAVAAELAAEARHCYAFGPTVELMREAHRTGRKIIVVSDTYLDAAQLRALIAAAAGQDVAGLIDQIYCSSAYGLSKGEGLYREVLQVLPYRPYEILHIGDNAKSDVAAVAPLGVCTFHLRQFSEATEQRLRLESSVSAILHPMAAETIVTHQPHRPILAALEPQIDDPAEALGFSVLGPVLHGFERWLAEEVAALEVRSTGRVHCVYLMRDGHLPRLMHEAAGRAGTAHAIEISRFTATAASFVDKNAILRYLQREVNSDPRAIARQLLIPEREIDALWRGARNRSVALFNAVRTPARLRSIAKASAIFADRLIAHVRALVNPAPGDTLMFVDLGYNGSVQNDVEPLLREKMGVAVAGRYLLLREQAHSGFDKKGFLDGRNYDDNALEALSANVAVLEQLCTAARGSVVDYKADGAPIRRDATIKSRQSATREQVQAGCIRFTREQSGIVVRADGKDSSAQWRRGAAAVLARLMFLPLPHELDVLQQFEHDVNLGVDNMVALFDPEIARRGLRQRGLFYMKGAGRMYLPAELNGEGLSLKLSLLAQRRFRMPLHYADFPDRSISLPVIVADGDQVTTASISATPTHDGYYVAPIPIGDCRFSVGILFGQLYDWLQIDSAMFIPVEQYLSESRQADMPEIAALPSLEGLEQTAPHLFRCEDEFAFMMVPPPPRQDDRPMMLAVVFRPIAIREAAMAAPVSAPMLEPEVAA